MDRKKYVVLVAGGSGTRMGSVTPKQFLDLCGAPVLQRTAESFLRAIPGIRIVTVLPEAHMDTWKSLCLIHHLDCPQTLVCGGITRFHSVRNALERVPDGAVVAIHDGVRPLIDTDTLRRLFAAMETSRAVIPVIPETDTLKSLEKTSDGVLRDNGAADPDRSRVWRVQTPQIFRSEDIRAAYAQAFDTSFTDDASVARRMGLQMDYLEGDVRNIKLTTPEDMDLARYFMEQQSNFRKEQ